MELSKYQKDIINWVKDGRGNLIIEASAGSGKSSTLLEISNSPSVSNGILLAYNVHIAKELNSKIKRSGIQAKTNHSLGMSFLTSYLGNGLKVDSRKYGDLCREEVDNWLGRKVIDEYHAINHSKKKLSDYDIKNKLIYSLAKGVSLVQNTLSSFDSNSLFDLDDQYEFLDRRIPVNFTDVTTVVTRVILEGIDAAKKSKHISYEDMLYLPAVWDLDAPVKYDWILVDEAQDLNAGQLYLVSKIGSSSSRYVFCGDPSQSLNGYCGSDTDSFKKLETTFSCTSLPLPITYRCPPNHIQVVKFHYPDMAIEAHKTENGILSAVTMNDFVDVLSSSDGVIGRRNRDLVEACLKCIGKGKKAFVKGKDVGRGLISLINKVTKGSSVDAEDLYELLYSYVSVEEAKLKDPLKVESLRDKVSSIYSCISFFAPDSSQELCDSIENLFSDKDSGVMFRSIHSAKGLEFDRVFIINYFIMPLPRVMPDTWQYQQELNCRFVALTRSRGDLYFVASDEDDLKLHNFYLNSIFKND
jgi:superfamily I DNA/RNA helicase